MDDDGTVPLQFKPGDGAELVMLWVFLLLTLTCAPGSLWYHIWDSINDRVGYSQLLVNQLISRCFIPERLFGQRAHQELQQPGVEIAGRRLSLLAPVRPQPPPRAVQAPAGYRRSYLPQRGGQPAASPAQHGPGTAAARGGQRGEIDSRATPPGALPKRGRPARAPPRFWFRGCPGPERFLPRHRALLKCGKSH